MTSRPPTGELVHNVAGLLVEPPGTSRTYAVSGVTLDLGPEQRQASPVGGTVRVARTNRGLLVNGHLETSLEGQCSRCLRDITVPLGLEIDEEVLPSVDLATGQPVDPSAEPEAARLTDHHELDLEPLLRDAILLAEPIAPLCRPDCPGLCVVCGEELGSGPHDHADGPIDPRLEALRAFRVDGGPETG